MTVTEKTGPKMRTGQVFINLTYLGTSVLILFPEWWLYALTLISFIQYCYVVFIHREELSQYRPWGGYANLLTTFRWILFWFVGIFHENIGTIPSAFLLLTGIVLDAFDGFVARKRGEVTEAGGLLDVEADSFFMATICILLYLKIAEEPLLIAAGYMRWVYLIIKRGLGWELKSEGRQPHARIMAIFAFVGLFFAFIAGEWSLLIVRVAGLIVLVSFGISFLKLANSK